MSEAGSGGGDLLADDRRAQVVDALLHHDARLCATYETAMDQLGAASVPGREAIRVLSICHYMRELMMGLPAVMSDEAESRPESSPGALLGKLPALRAKYPGLDLTMDERVIAIPQAVAREFDALITTAMDEQGRNRRNFAALINGGTHDSHPAVDQWLDAYGFFVGWAHLDRNHERGGALPPDLTLRKHIRVVEDVIVVRAALFFDNLRAIEDILALANAVDDGGDQ